MDANFVQGCLSCVSGLLWRAFSSVWAHRIYYSARMQSPGVERANVRVALNLEACPMAPFHGGMGGARLLIVLMLMMMLKLLFPTGPVDLFYSIL